MSAMKEKNRVFIIVAEYLTQKLALKILEFPEMAGTMAASLERSLSPPTETALRDNVVLNLQFGSICSNTTFVMGCGRRL